jgi:hypothetical protein
MRQRLLSSAAAIVFMTISVQASTTVPANHPYIQYYGRWDFSDSLSPAHSWPGVYIYAEFEGTSIGVKMNDNTCYYNVFIDDTVASVFHPALSGVSTYTVAQGLTNGRHTILLTKRNETTGAKYSFHGFVLDDGKNLLPPPDKPLKKIEFIGDSYTSASGNEWIDNTKPLDKETQYTNIYEGFGPVTARHYRAQYQMTSQAGYGLVLDWQGIYSNNIPDKFDRTLCYWNLPKWDFEQWIPNLVVICLGLNDCNAFGGYSGQVGVDSTRMFKTKYHTFITKIRTVYPGVKILAVAAAHADWIQRTVSEVVSEEQASGKNDVFYTFFPKYDASAYVFGDHPTAATHRLIANRLISAIDSIDAWTPSVIDTTPPRIVDLPASPLIVYDTAYVLKFETDTYATVRYSVQDVPYGQMEFPCTMTGKRNHSTTLYGHHNQSHKYYFRAIDVHGNAMNTSAVLQIQVDTSKYSIPWMSERYNDAAWNNGPAPLGTAQGAGNNTVFSKVTSAYFRKIITLDSIKYQGYALTMKGNDGAVIYVNGSEAYRFNMYADSIINYRSLAIGVPSSFTQVAGFNSKNGLLDKFKKGENCIAAEIHSSDTSRDVSFDAQFYDAQNIKYFSLGSRWNYSAQGSEPGSQIGDKTTRVPEENNSRKPFRLQLHQNYPNPFNPTTSIEYSLEQKSYVQIDVFNVLGQHVRTLVKEQETAGVHSVSFDAGTLSSGVYFYRLAAGGWRELKKMILMK